MPKTMLCALIALLFTLAAPVHAQVMPEGRTLSFSYYGDLLLHPGIKVSYEHPIWVKEKISKRKNLPKAHVLFAVADVGTYVHPGAHTALMIGGGAGYRKLGKRGGLFDVQAALWATHRINAGQTVKVVNGQASESGFLAGRSYLMPSLAMSFGRNLYVKRKVPLTWFVRPRFGFLLPYNEGGVLPVPALETGVSWTFNAKTNRK